MSFQGWPEAALDFSDDLEEDNSRAYWTAHRREYQDVVLGPVTELTGELSPESGPVRILRPYRDAHVGPSELPEGRRR